MGVLDNILMEYSSNKLLHSGSSSIYEDG